MTVDAEREAHRMGDDPAEQADELERRLVNSIKAGDPAKFQRGIKKINNMKTTKFSVIDGNDDE